MPKHLAYYMLSFSEKWNKILKFIYVYGAMYVFSSTIVWFIQDNRMHALLFWTSVSKNIGVFVWVCACVSVYVWMQKILWHYPLSLIQTQRLNG